MGRDNETHFSYSIPQFDIAATIDAMVFGCNSGKRHSGNTLRYYSLAGARCAAHAKRRNVHRAVELNANLAALGLLLSPVDVRGLECVVAKRTPDRTLKCVR